MQDVLDTLVTMCDIFVTVTCFLVRRAFAQLCSFVQPKLQSFKGPN